MDQETREKLDAECDTLFGPLNPFPPRVKAKPERKVFKEWCQQCGKEFSYLGTAGEKPPPTCDPCIPF